MKRLFATALLAAFATSAVAADLQLKSPAPRAADDWTRIYVGLQGGWNLGSFAPFCQQCGATGTEINLDDNSPFVGGQLGFDYHLNQSPILVGVEAGVQYLGFKSQAELAPATTETAAVLLQQKIDWLAYLNARAGFVLGQNLLVYGTGGVAWAHAKGEILNVADLNTANTNSVTGWNLGGGFEYKLWQNASFAFEYRHYDFGTVQAASGIFAAGLSGSRLSFEQAMGKLNFRLN